MRKLRQYLDCGLSRDKGKISNLPEMRVKELARGEEMNIIIEFIQKAVEWYIQSGLAEKCLDMLGRIITYDSTELIQYMWDFINTLFPNGGVL